MLSYMKSPADISYLIDSLILLRYFETKGEIKQAISVVKNRDSRHERMIREFQITPAGIRIGEPLRDFRGALTGVPTYFGEPFGSDDNE